MAVTVTSQTTSLLTSKIVQDTKQHFLRANSSTTAAHIHINNGTAMTEKTHRDTSKILYYIKNDKLTTTKIRTNKVGKGDY